MHKVVPLTSGYAASAASVLFQAFTQDAYSWGRALGRSPDAFKGFVEHAYVPECVRQGRSFVAVLPCEPPLDARQPCVGVLAIEGRCLCARGPTPQTPEMGADHEDRGTSDAGMLAIQSLLAALDDIFWHKLKEQQADEDQAHHAYFAFLAVDQDHRRLRVADSLVRAGVEASKARECGFCVAHCVSPASAAVFARAGFESWGAGASGGSSHPCPPKR
jgi:ribosomal protein S18 acetylase RimI-like enzyme